MGDSSQVVSMGEVSMQTRNLETTSVRINLEEPRRLSRSTAQAGREHQPPPCSLPYPKGNVKDLFTPIPAPPHGEYVIGAYGSSEERLQKAVDAGLGLTLGHAPSGN